MDANRKLILIVVLVFALRLPFLNQAIQGDDPYYLYGAEHAQIDPLHPHHARYLFQGDLVDMRGFPHPPLNAWILAVPLALFGDVREAAFHLWYILFSLIAALSMWSLASRFSDKPLLATLLFLAVPAFVVNGNSFESDLPFLAFWMLAIALFVRAVDQGSWAALSGAAASSVLAGL
jgi:4-amino-4-deoxy-L-arabinose transferase-like glycosyltransferase